MNVCLINENYTEEYTKNLLRARGIDDFDGFVNPKSEYLQNPNRQKQTSESYNPHQTTDRNF